MGNMMIVGWYQKFFKPIYFAFNRERAIMDKKITELMEVLNTIYEYHDMKVSDQLKRVWIYDLKDYSLESIKGAWNAYRKDLTLSKYKPKSYDIVRLAKMKEEQKTFRLSYETSIKGRVVSRGHSKLKDLIRQELERLKKKV